jgi:single-strand DNA-binding protein
VAKKKTGWIKVVCFNRLAEIEEKHLHNGARIALIGVLDYQKWTTDEGYKKLISAHRKLN